ncbi:hypothetical protein Leryth_012827 [Lithospermum erythrorhizon]|nr:hypothetical protein Leryth_012827 [Lithospermum erythrorhizon]
MTAELEADVIEWGGGRPNVAVFKDYVVYINGDKEGKEDLWLAMHPNIDAGTNFSSALLNGLEVFKLSDPKSGSLGAPNPPLVMSTNKPPPEPLLINQRKSKVWLIASAVIGCGGALVVAFLIFSWRMRSRKDSGKEKSSSKKSSNSVGSSIPAMLCRHFQLEEIKRATSNFDDNRVIGVGGFGNVYKGYIEDHINGATEVAIKRLDKSSKQGLNEFLTEIEMLSKLRHLHLVSLIGYCDDNGEMILVYDYMSHGTLRDHLNKSNHHHHHLSWKRRLQICIGAAKGLDYLHTWANHSIIHRDVKSTNILLDEKWVAKVSDFGLSKLGPMGGTKTYVSTLVKGSFGYLDPEYLKRRQLTEKSDVYSFGVVLFEVLCSRPAIMHNAPKEEVSLAGWVRFCKTNGTLDQIVDPKLKGEISPECLNKYIEIGLRCLKIGGIERPSMSDVVWNLEFALQLQEAADEHHCLMIEECESKQGSPLTIIPLLSHGFQATSEDR